ncbi:MAG: aminotransferase class V-fold PLP-dependent enzyme [Burkholderiaceae bacterium]
MSRITGHRFLHSPGPTRVPDEVAHAMSRQPMDLADPRVAQTIAACEDGLRQVLGTRSDVFMYAANGHGAWEATIVNLLGPGQSVLIAGTGHFSESWAVQSESLGANVVRTPWAEGESIDVAAVEKALRDDREHAIVAVFAVHTDTASSLTSDLVALRAAIDAAGHPALFVVDVVASLAAAPFVMDALRADVAIGASQKGLMVPPGLSFVAVNAAAMAIAQRNPAPRFYWDWVRRQGDMPYRKFCGTPPQSLLAGLEAALALIEREGLAEVHARHRLMADAVHAAVGAWSEAGGVRFFGRLPPTRSVSVTTLLTAPGIDPEAVRAVARERFQVAIAGGLGPLTSRVLRIGHLGDTNPAMILGCLGGLQAAFQVCGVPIGSDGVRRAVEVFARSAAQG